MNLLVPLAGLLGFEIKSITKQVRNAIIINAIIAMFGSVGLLFLVAAGFLALADAVGVIYAALIFAAAFLVLAIGVYLGSMISSNRHKREVAERRRSTESTAFVTTAAVTALPTLMKSPALRTLALPAAALAAFIWLGRNHKTDE